MTRHIPYLDGWRGLAIASLLVGHFFPVPGLNLGTVGVALFFVLSGLLMARVLFIQKTDLGTFYRRRIARVFPSVLVYLVVIATIFLVSGDRIAQMELLAAMTFTNNYFVTAKWTMPLGHIWSLSVEEHSYVMLSIAAFWCRSKGARGLGAIAFILALNLLAVAMYSFVPGASSPGFQLRTEVASIGIFASGCVFLALIQTRMKLRSTWIAPLALVVGVMCHWWSLPIWFQVVAGWGALALAVNAIYFAPQRFISLLEFSWLRKLGMYSFSLYLWQQPYYQLVHHSGMQPVLGFVLAVMTGIVAFHLIENPARLYLNRRWSANSLSRPLEGPADVSAMSAEGSGR
jgi:peptidoglycan/LPS O-acetylase OafA/YrhL